MLLIFTIYMTLLIDSKITFLIGFYLFIRFVCHCLVFSYVLRIQKSKKVVKIQSKIKIIGNNKKINKKPKN